jgi:hypothetical protein
MIRRRRPPPLTLIQLSSDLWRVAWTGRPSFECNTHSLRWVLGQLSPQQQRRVIRAALAEREKRRAQP